MSNENTATPPTMKCGHTANAVRKSDDAPVCVVCLGISAGADEIDVSPPSLEGRMARCSYGAHRDVPSSQRLAFFEHTPGREFDRYYCGCFGWD